MRNWTVNALTRMQLGGVVLGLTLAMSAAVPAAAQDLTGTSTPALDLTGVTAVDAASQTPAAPSVADVTSTTSWTLPADVSFLADDQRPGTPNAPTHEMHGKQVLVMVQGGFVTGGGASGFDIGVGASFKPIRDNNKFEVGADANLVHVSDQGFGSSGAYISFNGQYDIHMQNSKAVPFVGGGIGILHAYDVTDTDLQIFGGVDFETAGGRAIRAQIRFLFTTETTTLILVGFAF